MANSTPSFAPPNALRMWTDGRNIYVELPAKDGCTILSYSHTEGGLSKALSLLKVHADFAGTPVLRDSAQKLVGSALQHATAQSLLRRKGLIR